MRRAQLMLRQNPVYRREAVRQGLIAAGFEVVAEKVHKPHRGDVVVMWNRYGHWDLEARRFEAAGAEAVVMENGYLGKDWLGDSWYAMAIGHHAGRGRWPHSSTDAPPARWDACGVALPPWREASGGEVVVLHQRGIGEPGIASPSAWAERVAHRLKARIRTHPAAGNTIELEHDVRNTETVVTWGSGAALRCMLWGIHCFYDMPGWIGAPASVPLRDWKTSTRAPSEEQRLQMFRRLIWAQWRLTEIEDGTAFRALLGA